MTHATITFEIDVTVSGTFTPGYRSTYNDPGEPDRIEDIDVEDIGAVIFNRSKQGASRFSTVSLLDGVDRNSEAFRQIVENILRLFGEDAATALLDDEMERAA